MCPACYATMATVLAGTASAGSLTAVIATFVYRKKLAEERVARTTDHENRISSAS